MKSGVSSSLKRASDEQTAIRMVGSGDKSAREQNDFYPTPPAATLALLSAEKFNHLIWEPACGDGAISKVLIDSGYEVVSTDLVDRGYGTGGIDFLMEWQSRAPDIVTNPPFKLLLPFLDQALRLTIGKVAMLLRITALEGQERATVFEQTPLARVLVFRRRLTFRRGGGDAPASGGMLAYAWFVWDHSHKGPPTLGWL